VNMKTHAVYSANIRLINLGDIFKRDHAEQLYRKKKNDLI
jgi:hypothetical protein